MIKYVVMRNFRGTCPPVDTLKVCMVRERLVIPVCMWSGR